MKYLKIFEEYGDESYYRITSDIGKYIDDIKWYNLTNVQINKICELGVESTKYLHGDEKNKKISRGTYFIINGISTQVMTSDDEWFLFVIYKHDWLGDNRWSPSYYMCDQFDGLLECIKFAISKS